MKYQSIFTAIFTAIFLLTAPTMAMAAVGNEKSTAYVREAEEYLKNGDVKAAIIQMKNAVVADPKNSENRVALADLYLRNKNAVSAEKEYIRAIELGFEKAKTIINLSKARLLLRQHQIILDTLREEDIKADEKGDYFLITGKSHQGLGNMDKALEFFIKGEKEKGENDALAIAIAQIYYFQKDMDKSEKKVDEALAQNPKNIKGLILKGELVNIKQGPEKSLSYFQQALEYDDKNIPALFKLAAILYDLNRSDEALEKLDAVFSLAPKHPLANYLSAVIYARKNDYDRTEEFLNASGQALDNFPGALMLRGMVNYSKGNYAQSIYFLNRLMKVTPKNIIARRLLAASLLRQNDAGQAIKVLMPIVDEGKAGSVIYALLGSAKMKLGKFEEGTAFFEKAVESSPGEDKLKTQLALSKLASGNAQAAQANLQEVLANDPNSKQASAFMTLISLREKNFDKALASAEIMIGQSPDNAVGYNLKGAALMGQKKMQEAKAQFNKALEVSPSYHSASMNLALLEIQAGNRPQARKIYENILKVNDKYIGALMALARMSRQDKDIEATEGYFQRAVDAAPKNIGLAIEYSEYFISRKKMERAKSIIQNIIIDYPDQAAGYEAMGNINNLMGDFDDAVGNFERMTAILGNNAGAYLLLGRAQVRSNDLNAARETFQKALEMTDSKAALIINLAGLETTEKNYDKALEYVNQLKQIDDNNPSAYIMEGRLLAIQKKYSNSVDSFLIAEGKGAKSSGFTIDFFRSYLGNGQADIGVEKLKEWLTENENDLAVRHILAGYYLQEKEYQKSINQYEIILKQRDNNPVALNNIAWLYGEVGQNEKALTISEKAYKLFPEEASFIDTHAWILVQQGQNDKGLELLQKALSINPDMTEIRYHLAVALNNAGRKAVARKELVTVISSGDNFSGLEDARKLLNELSQ